MYFTTTRLHQELAGGIFVDVIIDEAHDPRAPPPVQGQRRPRQARGARSREDGRGADRLRLPRRHREHGRRPAGHDGQRREACATLCDRHGIRLFLDATRMVENALLHPGARGGLRRARPIAEILLEFCSYTDGAWMSAKKDTLVNIGGWLALNDDDLFEEPRNLVVVFEGLHTYGGLAGRDMEAMAIGIEESVQDDHIRVADRAGALPRRAARGRGASRSCGRSAATRSSSTRGASTRTCRRTSSRRRRSPRSSTSTPASARWSAASSRPAATRRPATTTARSSS